ncbi:MAG: MarR family winged helix-turn-helix transcriptional regulator [bacterium]
MMNVFPNRKERLVIGLHKISLAVRTLQIRKGESLGLTPLQQQVLMEIKRRSSQAIPIGDLARILGVKPPTITASVNTLVKKNLVEKVRNSDDKRAKLLLLTPSGEIFSDGCLECTDDLSAALEGLSEQEQVTLMRLIVRLIEEFQRKGLVQKARICLTCRFFEPWAHPGSSTPHHCHFINAPLSDGDLQTDCTDFIPKNGEKFTYSPRFYDNR